MAGAKGKITYTPLELQVKANFKHPTLMLQLKIGLNDVASFLRSKRRILMRC